MPLRSTSKRCICTKMQSQDETLSSVRVQFVRFVLAVTEPFALSTKIPDLGFAIALPGLPDHCVKDR